MTRKQKIFVAGCVVISICTIATLIVRDVTSHLLSASNSDIEACLLLDSERDACYASLCNYEVGYVCAEEVVALTTKMRGPEVGIQSLHDIVKGSVFNINTNGHFLAHVIGRSAARHWGISGDVFNQCPIDFDYGCLHGFFEVAMIKAGSPTKALLSICEGMPHALPFDKVNCYHGGGHGIMMNESYNLERALLMCDSLPSTAQTDCFGGVFMENTNGFKNNIVEEDRSTFRSDNPRAPCDSVADKYAHECWILHADYLIEAYSTSLDELIAVCLGASDYVEVCLRGVARIFSADRQNSILSGSGLVELEGSFVDRTFYLCNTFPSNYMHACHTMAISQLIAPDNIGTGFDRASDYCMLLDYEERKTCFSVVASRLGEIVSEEVRGAMCKDIPEEYQGVC